MYVDRDDDGNIVSIYVRPQRNDHERLAVQELKQQLDAQPLKWGHGIE